MEVICEFGCSQLDDTLISHSDCPTHNPIDIKRHDDVLKHQEPIRDELRIANTTEALRNRVVAASNGHKVNGVHFEVPRPRRLIRDSPQA